MTTPAHIEVLRQLPPNFTEFVDEIAAGLTGIYGPKAGEQYHRTAAHAVGTSMAHASVTTWAAQDDSGTTALLMGITRETVGQLGFLHVLHRSQGQGLESRLISRAVAQYRERGLAGIVCEFVPLCDVDLNATFATLGFDRVDRLLLHAPLQAPGLAQPTLRNSHDRSAICPYDLVSSTPFTEELMGSRRQSFA